MVLKILEKFFKYLFDRCSAYWDPDELFNIIIEINMLKNFTRIEIFIFSNIVNISNYIPYHIPFIEPSSIHFCINEKRCKSKSSLYHFIAIDTQTVLLVLFHYFCYFIVSVGFFQVFFFSQSVLFFFFFFRCLVLNSFLYDDRTVSV